MGTTTVRYLTPGRPTAARYWRRRFVALFTGLSVLALLTWAVSSLLTGLAPGQPAGAPGASIGDHHGRSARSSAAVNSVLRPCPANDVVLSLFSSQLSYSAGQRPEFQVDVVSTASQACTFDIGASHVWLQISAGGLRVWTSAACAAGQSSRVADLHRGVPTVVSIGWNGQISAAGCPTTGTAVGNGSYSATALDGVTSSNTLVFRLS